MKRLIVVFTCYMGFAVSGSFNTCYCSERFVVIMISTMIGMLLVSLSLRSLLIALLTRLLLLLLQIQFSTSYTQSRFFVVFQIYNKKPYSRGTMVLNLIPPNRKPQPDTRSES